jgi:hypothetical protein
VTLKYSTMLDGPPSYTWDQKGKARRHLSWFADRNPTPDFHLQMSAK